MRIAFLPFQTLVLALSLGAHAEPCAPLWEDEYTGMLDPFGVVNAGALFDDGGGPAVYLGGAPSGAAPTAFFPHGMARLRDGRMELVTGLHSPSASGPTIHAMIVHDDGSGPALYVAGEFAGAGTSGAANIARWTGAVWQRLGANLDGVVHDLAVFDEDGPGPAPSRLFATGRFAQAGGVVVNGVARWDGQAWSGLGEGLYYDGNPVRDGRALAAVAAGEHRGLYVGGRFIAAGTTEVRSLARWDGTAWSALAHDEDFGVQIVEDLAWYDDGGGAALWVGGAFSSPVGHALVCWKDGVWAEAGFEAGSAVRRLGVCSVNGESELLVVGALALPGGPATPIARRTSHGLEALQLELGTNSGGSGVSLHSILPDGAGGEGALLGGFFHSANGLVARCVLEWSGETFRPALHSGGLGGTVTAFALDHENQSLYVGGGFNTAGNALVRNVAVYDGEQFGAVGAGLPEGLRRLVIHESADGTHLYAAGGDSDQGVIWRHQEGSWATFATANAGPITALASVDGQLFAGGFFNSIEGVFGHRIAVHDPDGWRALGIGLWGVFNHVVAIHPWQGGVVIGGHFSSSGQTPMSCVAFWDGNVMTPMGEGLNQTVRGFAVYRGDLYAVGDFDRSGKSPVSGLARWTGGEWVQGPGAPNASAEAIAVFDDGSGPALYVGGEFTSVDDLPVNYVARWNGASWSALGAGLNGPVRALLRADLGSGPDLYVGGDFTEASGLLSYGIARWNGCLATCPGDVNGDLAVNFEDLNAFLAAFHSVQGDADFNNAADFNADGIVDFRDLNLLVSGFHSACGEA